MSDFSAPQSKDKIRVLIGASELRQAERLIQSCEECNPSAAKVPFDKILDFVTDSNPATTDYILEPLAKCPNCRRDILEKDSCRAGLTMPRTRINLEKIRAELTWVTETPDPNKCGCRNVRCCETEHRPGTCSRSVGTKFWSFRWEYYCNECREYEWNGSKRHGYMTTRG